MKTNTEIGKGWTNTTTHSWFRTSSHTVFNHKTGKIRPRINVTVDNRQVHLHSTQTQRKAIVRRRVPLLQASFIEGRLA